jgi:hypothetical protein
MGEMPTEIKNIPKKINLSEEMEKEGETPRRTPRL